MEVPSPFRWRRLRRQGRQIDSAGRARILLFDGRGPGEIRGGDGDCPRATRGGHEALLAGGCVRDLLLGREPKDHDGATGGGARPVSADLCRGG
ncbi:MAG: hypothetical protein WCE75_14080 [Terracidiphilus sp.]